MESLGFIPLLSRMPAFRKVVTKGAEGLGVFKFFSIKDISRCFELTVHGAMYLLWGQKKTQ